MSAPLDHVAPGYDRVCVPPHGQPMLVCGFWPECQCGDDCVDHRDAIFMRRLVMAFTAATLAIGAGLIIWGMRS